MSSDEMFGAVMRRAKGGVDFERAIELLVGWTLLPMPEDPGGVEGSSPPGPALASGPAFGPHRSKRTVRSALHVPRSDGFVDGIS